MSGRVTGVVLAAGRSRRMGRPKALLRHGSDTFLDRMAQALRRGGCRPVLAVVSGEPQTIRQACRLEGVRLLVNPSPEQGQISSLRLALQACPDAEGLLVVLVDQGEISPESVRRAGEALEPGTVVVTRHGGRGGHPTVFHRELFPRLLGPDCDRGAHLLVEALAEEGRRLFIDVEDPGVLRNMNHPEDYQAFVGQGGDGDHEDPEG